MMINHQTRVVVSFHDNNSVNYNTTCIFVCVPGLYKGRNELYFV